MSKVVATLVDDIEDVAVAADGRHAFFKLRVSDEYVILALPDRLLTELVRSAVAAAGGSQQILHGAHEATTVIGAQEWEIADMEEHDALIVKFHLQGGLTMAFQVGHNQIGPIRKTLDALARGSSMSRPATNTLQ
jgi:hypothetical protein